MKFTLTKAEQSLRGIRLHEKEDEKDEKDIGDLIGKSTDIKGETFKSMAAREKKLFTLEHILKYWLHFSTYSHFSKNIHHNILENVHHSSFSVHFFEQ